MWTLDFTTKKLVSDYITGFTIDYEYTFVNNQTKGSICFNIDPQGYIMTGYCKRFNIKDPLDMFDGRVSITIPKQYYTASLMYYLNEVGDFRISKDGYLRVVSDDYDSDSE